MGNQVSTASGESGERREERRPLVGVQPLTGRLDGGDEGQDAGSGEEVDHESTRLRRDASATNLAYRRPDQRRTWASIFPAAGFNRQATPSAEPRERGDNGGVSSSGADSSHQQEDSSAEEFEDVIAGPRQISPYVRLAEDGRWRLVRTMFKDEWAFHESVLRGIPEEIFFSMAFPVLLSTEDKLLKLILRGNLQRAKRRDPRIRQLLERMEAKSERQLCHYLFEFVNSDGISPSPSDLLKIADVAERYMDSTTPEDFRIVELVDNWVRPWKDFTPGRMRQGKRRYLPNEPSRQKLREFLGKLRQFLRGEPGDRPLSQPLCEVGYAANGPERIKDHEKHNNSNYLMNLFEAIAAKHFGWRYRNQGAVIYLCFDQSQGAIGEIVWSCLAQAYTKTGRGFSHEPAGGSNRSIELDSKFEHWQQWQNDAWERGPFQVNLKRERKLAQQANAERDRLEEERWNLVRVFASGGFNPRDAQDDGEGQALEVGEVDGPRDALTEFRRMETEGEFASLADRQLAEDIVRNYLLYQRRVLQSVDAELERLELLLQKIHDGASQDEVS